MITQTDPALHQQPAHQPLAGGDSVPAWPGCPGLALFHPALFWLSNLFGGGPWTRILHPFMGVLMFVLFLGLVLQFLARQLSLSPTTGCGCGASTG